MEHCDWEVDYSVSPMVLLPHLGTTRDGMFLIQFSIQGDIENRKIGEAVEGVHAIMLAMTFAISIENGVANNNPEAWDVLINTIGIPDNDAVVVAILEE
ncbi:MAG: hypothetical protein ACKVIO_05175 [Phycisphaerales bacterium]